MANTTSKFTAYKKSNSDRTYFEEELTVKTFRNFTSKKGRADMKLVLFEGHERPFTIFNNAITGKVSPGMKVQVTAYETKDSDFPINIVAIDGEQSDVYDKIAFASEQGAVLTF